MYPKICRKLHRTGRGWVPRGSVSKPNAFTYFTKMIDAISCIDIMRTS